MAEKACWRRWQGRFLCILALLVPPPGHAEDAAAPAAFSGDALLEHVRCLVGQALEGRGAGQPGELLAAEYIAKKLDDAGIGPPPGSDRFQRFPVPRGGEPLESRNVLGWIEGADSAQRETFIVLGAHMDHLGKRGESYYPGADDNASGVSVVLEVAARLQTHRRSLGRSVLVAFFGAEEVGLHGSRFLVASGIADKARIRFSLFTFKLPGKKRPAWDFQYVVHRVEEDREYGFRARLIWKPWVSREDCLAEYERWKEGLPGARQ